MTTRPPLATVIPAVSTFGTMRVMDSASCCITAWNESVSNSNPASSVSADDSRPPSSEGADGSRDAAMRTDSR